MSNRKYKLNDMAVEMELLKPVLGVIGRDLLNCLDEQPMNLQMLCLSTGNPVDCVRKRLEFFEDAGIAYQKDGKWYLEKNNYGLI